MCSGPGQADARSTPIEVVSPDGRIKLAFRVTDAGAPLYQLALDGKPVLRESKLGLVRDDADFSKGLKLGAVSPTRSIADDYEILTGKRRANRYRAKQKIFHLQTGAGRKLDIICQTSNDGVAFRYCFPEQSPETRQVLAEVTSFHFLPETKAWLQPIAVAGSGWKKTNPCYEEFYETEIPVGTPCPTGAGWVYPALFRTGQVWLLISEVSVPRNYCATRLRPDSPDGEYGIGFPDQRETVQGGPAGPESSLPWMSPWRIIVVGSLKTVAESTLGTDVADKPAIEVAGPIETGKAAWSWALLGDAHTTYDTQKRFVDYAAAMGWRYCLIDALWDKQIGYERMKGMVDYASSQGVRILLWYNSAGDWNTVPLTPRDLMLSHESRANEFERLKHMGIAGLKIDFFAGDGQSVMGYYHDILTDAAAYGFVMNFHGATLPRGWQRTYPHLMTMEAVRGMEHVTFAQADADREAAHATLLPFTRNVFDPMDFTPMVLDRLNDRVQRRTTSTFELATAVLFTSGIQHYAEIPEGMAKVPDFVRDFIKGIPSVWDDLQFIDGEPGRFVVIARRGSGRWYVAGMNGENQPRTLTLEFAELGISGRGTLIGDGEAGNLSFTATAIAPDHSLELMLKPRGGFVAVLEH